MHFKLFDKIKGFFSAIASYIGAFFDVWTQSMDDVQGIVDDFNQTKSNVELEIEKLKNFKFDPKWKNRVINVPIAIDQMKDLIDLVSSTYKEKLLQIVAPFHDLLLTWKAAQTDRGDPNSPNALVKADVFLKDVQTALHLVRKACDNAKDVSAVFIELTDQLAHLDAFFLQQGNARKRVDAHPRIRVGVLHE